MKLLVKAISQIVWLLLLANIGWAQSETRTVCDGLTVPWDLEYLPDNQLIFTEINGRIGKVNLATGEVKTLLQVPEVARELQAGLLGLALHPDFLRSKKIYVAFTSYKGDALVLRIAELGYHPENESLTFSKIIFDGIPAGPTDIGGRLMAFEGHLFLTVGDLEQTEQAQNLQSLNGKILRLNLDGSIPDDNPFPGSPVWALGLRNSQGLASAHGSVFCTEHGTMDNDELNMVIVHSNMGWPLLAGNVKNMEEVRIAREIRHNHPLKTWTPTIAPAGVDFYNHSRYPYLKNCFLIANLFDQSLKGVRYDSANVAALEDFDLLSETAGRLRDVAIAPDGRIFVATSNSDSYGGQPAGSDRILEVMPPLALTEARVAEVAEKPAENNIVQALQLDSTALAVSIVATGLVHPWDMTWGFDNRIWFTENGGWIKRLDPATGKLDTLIHLGDCHFSWGNPGIYSLAFHPDFPKEPYLFVHYTNSATNSKLVRFRYDFTKDELVDSLSILPKIRANESHNGSRMVFTPDKKMFFAMGEAYTPELAQDLNGINGKILRLNLDGSVPDDNPFPGSLIWSYGHRNPQGLALLPNGTLWSSEHGANNDDELNIILKGRNYGWPKVQGMCDLRSEQRFCEANQVVEPVISWTPTVAPCALEYYDHPAIPEWRNSLMQVFLKKGKGKLGQRMTVFKLDETGTKIIGQQDFFNNTFGRLRDVLIAPDGRIFLCTSNMEVSGNGKKAVRPGDDKIIEVKPMRN